MRRLLRPVDPRDPGPQRRVHTPSAGLGEALGFRGRWPARVHRRAAARHRQGRVPAEVLCKRGQPPAGGTTAGGGAPAAGECLLLHEAAPVARRRSSTSSATITSGWTAAATRTDCEGDAVPPAARMIAVADVYDALISHRPYRRACAPRRPWGCWTRRPAGRLDAAVVAALRRVTADERLPALGRRPEGGGEGGGRGEGGGEGGGGGEEEEGGGGGGEGGGREGGGGRGGGGGGRGGGRAKEGAEGGREGGGGRGGGCACEPPAVTRRRRDR